MSKQVNIILEKKDSGYLLVCPELEDYQVEDDSLDFVFERLKERIKGYLEKKQTTGESILKMVANFQADMTEEEMALLPTDGAAQHDHYLYGTPKRQ